MFYVLVWYQPCVILARGHQECIEKGVTFCLQEGKAGVWFPKQVTDEVVHHDILGHLNERLQVRQGPVESGRWPEILRAVLLEAERTGSEL